MRGISQVTATGNSRALGLRKRERICSDSRSISSGNFLRADGVRRRDRARAAACRFVAAQIEHQLRVILAFQFLLDGALQFSHHRLELVHFFLRQLFEVLFQILGAFDAACFERRQQGITMLAPQA